MSNPTVGLRRIARGDELSVIAMRHAITNGAKESRLIRECLEVANHLRFSAEELFVYLAYHALVRLEECYQNRQQAAADQDGIR